MSTQPSISCQVQETINKVVYCEVDGLDKKQYCDIYKSSFIYFILPWEDRKMPLVPFLFLKRYLFSVILICGEQEHTKFNILPLTNPIMILETITSSFFLLVLALWATASSTEGFLLYMCSEITFGGAQRTNVVLGVEPVARQAP